MTVPTLSPDANLGDADWTKQTWDFPPYRSREFLEQNPDLDAFRRLPAYAAAVAAGLIHDDEWVADWAVPGGGKSRRALHVHIHKE